MNMLDTNYGLENRDLEFIVCPYMVYLGPCSLSLLIL